MYNSDLKKKCLRKWICEAKEGILDFTQTETNVLDLVFHYEFYYLKTRESPKFGKNPKNFYIKCIKQILDSGEKIRSCEVPLSSLIDEGEVKMIRMIKKIEEYHESK